MVKRCALMLVLALAPTLARAGPAEDAGALVERWPATSSASDRDGLAALYSPDAIRLGTTDPIITRGRDAIREYSAPLDTGGRRNVILEEHEILLREDAVAAAGFYDFSRKDQNFEPRPSRFTFVVVQGNGRWMIVHHHSSPRAEQRQ